MSGFHIKPDKVSALAEELNGYSGRLEEFKSEVGSVRNAKGISTSSYSSIQQRIKSLAEDLEEEKRKMGTMYVSLQSISKQYIDCENSITGRAQGTAIGGMEAPSPGTGGTGGGGGDQPWYADLPRETVNLILDVIEEAGDLGGSTAVINSIIKILMDHDGFTYKDAGAVIKSLGKTIMGASELAGEPWDWIEALGLNGYKAVSISQTAGWMGRLQSAKDTFESALNYEVTGDAAGNVIKGTKIAGWTLALVANGFSNYEEFSKGEITGERAVAETVLETGIDIGKGALLAAGVAAGAAALGIAAPAVVVGGVAVAASAVLDFACKQFTGKGVTELVSDTILDVGEAVVSGAQKVVSGIGNAVKDTFTGAVRSIGNILPKWKWSFG